MSELLLSQIGFSIGLLILFVVPLSGCKLPIDKANEKAGIVSPPPEKNLRGKRERVGIGTGLDDRAREIESNLGFR